MRWGWDCIPTDSKDLSLISFVWFGFGGTENPEEKILSPPKLSGSFPSLKSLFKYPFLREAFLTPISDQRTPIYSLTNDTILLNRLIPLGCFSKFPIGMLCLGQYYISKAILFLFLKLINLFMAALGLRCCARAFCSCGERRLLFFAVRGLLIVVASLVAEHGL